MPRRIAAAGRRPGTAAAVHGVLDRSAHAHHCVVHVRVKYTSTVTLEYTYTGTLVRSTSRIIPIRIDLLSSCAYYR
jgi:hypothetical protein